MDFAIETRNLTRRYGKVEAVSALNLKVTRQHITGFLGRNGAGKSTTIRMLLGMTHPSAGDATVLSHSITDAKSSVAIRRSVAYVGEDKELYSYMTVEEMVRFTSSFYPDWRPETAQRLQRQYELAPSRKVRDLSKGMRTKLALLLALSRRPELLILDEPSDGLDPISIEELLQSLIAAAAEGTAVFFSSHQIAEVERIAERVCIIDRGKLVKDLALDEMRQHYRRITLGFSTEATRQGFDIPGVEHLHANGRQMIIRTSHNDDAVVERARSLEAASIDVAPVTLRDLFIESVGDSQ